MVQIQVWGDFECPFSYLQTIVLAKLKKKYGDDLEIIWRAIELNPNIEYLDPSDEYLQSLRVAADDLISKEHQLKFSNPLSLSNIRIAQESVYFAKSNNLSLEMAIAIFEAFFGQNIDISDAKVLLDIANRLGLDAHELKEALKNGIYTLRVVKDEILFKTYGFLGIPALFVGEKDFAPDTFVALNGFHNFFYLDQMVRQALKR